MFTNTHLFVIMSAMDNLKKAIEVVGSQSELGRRIGASQQNVWHWLNKQAGRVPAEYVLRICAAVDNAVTPQDLRPDIFGEVVSVSPADEVS